ncbi:hypothetical protein ABIA35_008933 [Catenulispora sp. MAP12-49]|uniref:NB-ARC domain-containing protein n=1 Tax=unclassified Catenulispora TaxID=414885 RepID=UPI003511942A
MIEEHHGTVPDPDQVRDMAGLIEALNLLRAASGNPSFRTLARSAGLKLRPPQALAHTTVRDLFQARRRRLDIDLLMATVRALGLRDPEAARWQRACARAHVEARLGGPPRVLRQLPAATAVFTGRERDLAAVLKPATAAADGDHGANGAVTLAIDGMAGIGKTQLALHAAHELVNSGRFTDTQLYADLWGFDADHAPADPAVVLGTFLSQLGVAAQRIPAALEERAAMFRDQMHDRKALILLDNAAGAEQIRALIPSAPSCLVLVTSRRSLAGLDTAFLHTLDVFRPVESVTLLARIAGTVRITAEPAAATAIVEACGSLPLAIALAASRLRSRPAWTLADLADRLRAPGLGAFSAAGRTLCPVFDLSYRRLPAPAKFLFCALGLHADDEFSAAAALAAAAADGIGAAEADEILERLQDDHLVRRTTGGRYRFHDLIRRYAAGLAHTELTPEQLRVLARRSAAQGVTEGSGA